jgi:hypothetical protein
MSPDMESINFRNVANFAIDKAMGLFAIDFSLFELKKIIRKRNYSVIAN